MSTPWRPQPFDQTETIFPEPANRQYLVDLLSDWAFISGEADWAREVDDQHDWEDSCAGQTEFDYGLGLSSTQREYCDLLLGQINRFLGVRYYSGGDGRDKKGFDCSGFTMRIFQEALDLNLPHCSRDQFLIGEKVGRDRLQFGDLVFFRTQGRAIGHVGVYLGKDIFAHSATRRHTGIRLSSLEEPYYRHRYAGARRLPLFTPQVADGPVQGPTPAP